MIINHNMSAIFARKLGDDGNAFTPAHGTLVRLPLKGLVTTNYDPGLVEARHSLCPDAPATGFGVWSQEDACREWLYGNAFEDGNLPVFLPTASTTRPAAPCAWP